LLEFLAGYYSEANKQFWNEVEIDLELPISPAAGLGLKNHDAVCKTIIKPILKLRHQKKTTCQDYGKMIGIVSRGITFYRQGCLKIIEDEGLDEISKEDWRRFSLANQLRAYVVKQLAGGADTKPLERLGSGIN